MNSNFINKNDVIDSEFLGKVSVEQGLLTEQVKKIANMGYVNYVKNESYKSVWQIVSDNVFTFFNLIFFVLSLFLLTVHCYKDMLFMVVVLSNAFIGIFQQIRSKIKLDKLNLISTLKTTVIRNSKKIQILNSELVKGDIVCLKTGDQITVDAVVLKGEVQIDESLLTGEADPISKQVGGNLLSGSFVLSGNCLAQATQVGNSCYANKLTMAAKKNSKSNNSEMMKSLNKLIQLIGLVLVPIGLLMFFKEMFILHHSYGRTVQVVAAALVGMIPEGLYLLTSVALAMSVLKLIEFKTLVHEMSCIETLARIDVLCVDKTGTITQPKMQVVDLIYLNTKMNSIEINNLLNAVVFNMPCDNETVIALKKRFNKAVNSLNFAVKKIHPFLSSTKWFAVEFQNEGTFLLGAAEFIMQNDYFKIEKQVNLFAEQGKRVLLFAKFDGVIEKGVLNGIKTPLCLVLIENPIRETAFKTFRFFEQQGVKIKIISGDSPVAVSSICKKLKIKNAENFVDASKLKNDDEIVKALETATVFGRVTPGQKQLFIKLLQKNGKHTVAMTGDGVNDVLALRQADVGVAMASGSSAASQAAAIVLLNSNFSAMPKVVYEGRRVINNIERSAALFLVKNIFSFFFVVLSIFSKIGFPITPFQSTCISFLTIGMPSFLLTLENSAVLIKGKFLNNVFKKAMPGGICNVFMVFFIQIVTQKLMFSYDEISAMCVVVLAFNGFAILFEICRPINFKRSVVLILTFSVMISFFMFLIFSSSVLYFKFFLNYAIVGLVCLFFLLDYFVLKVLMCVLSFKIIKKTFSLFKNKMTKIVKFLKFY